MVLSRIITEGMMTTDFGVIIAKITLHERGMLETSWETTRKGEKKQNMQQQMQQARPSSCC